MKISANEMTMTRIVMVPFILIAYELGGLWGLITSLALLVSAEITDLLDGWIARKDGPTKIGKILDPAADVLLHVTIYAYYIATGRMPFIFFLLIMWREVSVTLLRGALALAKAEAIPASDWGKWKTVLYAVNQIIILIIDILEKVGVSPPYKDLIIGNLFIIATSMSLISGMTYLVPGVRELNRISQSGKGGGN